MASIKERLVAFTQKEVEYVLQERRIFSHVEYTDTEMA